MQTNECLLCIRIPLGEVMMETFDLINDEETARNIALMSAELIKKAWVKNRYLMCGKRPSGLLGGAIYISSTYHGERITQHQIAIQLDITKATIRKGYRLLLKILEMEEQFLVRIKTLGWFGKLEERAYMRLIKKW